MGESFGFFAVLLAVHALKITEVWGLVALVTGIASAVYSVKMRTTLDATRATGEAWKEERDAEKAKSDRLEETNDELMVEIERLRGLTNLTAVVEALEKMTGRIEQGGERASSEHAAILRSLQAMTDKISANSG